MIAGISSFTYGWNIGLEGYMPDDPMDELDLVNQTVGFGLNCLQIGDNLPLHSFDASRKERLRKEVIKNLITLEIGARKLDIENLQIYIELARYFQSPLLRFVIDGPHYKPNVETVIEIIQRNVSQLAENNIVLGIENHDRLKAIELAQIVQAVNHNNVGICLDCVNSVGAGEGLEHVANMLAPYTVNLHVKDFKTKRLTHNMGFLVEGEITGKGMLNLGWLLEKISIHKRCNTAILEQWVPPENEIATTLEKEKQWATQGISYLKSVLNKKQ